MMVLLSYQLINLSEIHPEVTKEAPIKAFRWKKTSAK